MIVPEHWLFISGGKGILRIEELDFIQPKPFCGLVKTVTIGDDLDGVYVDSVRDYLNVKKPANLLGLNIVFDGTIYLDGQRLHYSPCLEWDTDHWVDGFYHYSD